MKADYHVHTYYSDDSECPMEEMVRRAIELGLDEIALTEHVDYGVKTDLNCDYPAYFREVEKLREQYGDQIRICAGMEFGIQKETIPLYRRDAAALPLDFVILSNHQKGNKEYWTYEFQEGKTQEEFQREYYEGILEVVKEYRDYSVLGHLDLIKRYDPCGAFPDDRIMDMVEQIFHYVIADGKGIEINTSGLRYGLKEFQPSREILKLYYQMGGRILTIGSDAHKAVHLGKETEEAQRALREIGFLQFCTFDRMKPVFHDLVV